ncbi:thiamine pyrophosphate-dependent dehydrogenase E1 component subunit alpha, partial [bacterium]|nr:thiamine pyrophosphate-dependent dehydrogenase E1 component subunit alpha [bacterium]
MSVTTKEATGKVVKNEKSKAAKQKSVFAEFDPLKQKRLTILDHTGKIIAPEWMPDISDELLIEGYKTMKFARMADNKCVNYQRQGKMFTLPVNRGQEAVVGTTMAINRDDWACQAFREMAALLFHGVPIERMFMQNMGLEEGAVYDDVNATPMSVPIASQMQHACGIGHAIKYRGGKEVVVAYVGDGGTSTGDFHESLNWAAVFKCPVIFIINNNQYAISAHRDVQTMTPTLAQKAIAYQMPGIQVDGNDMLAVYRATSEAVEHARAGNGPSLIELLTYRMGAHTTSDDPSKYRDKKEETYWEARDPLARVKIYLESRKLWNDKLEKAHEEYVNRKIEAAFVMASAMGPNTVVELFSHQFAEMTNSLQDQMADLQAYLLWKEEH